MILKVRICRISAHQYFGFSASILYNYKGTIERKTRLNQVSNQRLILENLGSCNILHRIEICYDCNMTDIC
jgi:hypothetical protein